MDIDGIRRDVNAGVALKEQEELKEITQNTDGGGADMAKEPTMEDIVRADKAKDGSYSEAQKQEAYNTYVKALSPVKSLPLQMVKAFICGGSICMIGQAIINTAKAMGLDQDIAGAWSSLLLVLLSVVLTGFSVYQVIADWGGAGALVPITGFANSVASPAIEYKPEGQVYGIGVKIFTIAGPVILYGVFTSWLLGVIYWLTGFGGLM